MPYEDDEVRRAARERLEARMQRRGSADTLASNAAKRAQERERASEERAAARTSSFRRETPRPIETSGQQPKLYTKSTKSHKLEVGPLSLDIPVSAVSIAVPVIAVVVVLLLIFAVIVPSCTRAPEQSGDAAGQGSTEQAASSADASSAGTTDASAQAGQQGATQATGLFQKIQVAKDKAMQKVRDAGQVDSIDRQESHQSALSTLLGDETSAKLLAQAKTNVDALWIAAHAGAYAAEGLEVQHKVLKLAADEPAAIDYVREYPTSYPAAAVNEDKSIAMSTASPSSSVPDTDIPHLYQWDKRWGYTVYSSAAFGLTGCGPTSLAMVYQGVTGNNDKTPYDLGKLAEEGGYMDEYEGTTGSFFLEKAEELGLKCEEMYPEAETLRQALEHGSVVILNLAPGYFTQNGHYFVATELTSDGQVIINDPYSVERSSQTWDPELLASESYTMYAYAKA